MREICLHDYEKGLSCSQIATKREVSLNTIRSWHQRDEWGKRRKEYQAELAKAVFLATVREITKSSKRYLRAANLIAKMGLEGLREADSEPNDQAKAQRVRKWAYNLSLGVSLIKQSIPNADEVVIKDIWSRVSEDSTMEEEELEIERKRYEEIRELRTSKEDLEVEVKRLKKALNAQSGPQNEE